MRTLKYLLSLVLVGMLGFSCDDDASNTAPLVDPWLRERTPLSFRVEGQVGAATIVDDWRHDEVGSIGITMVTGAVESMSRVKVVDLELQYNATASVKPGDYVDLSSGSCKFVVTAENGETREYTVAYSAFREPLEGVYRFAPIGGILDGSAPKSSVVIVGGWDYDGGGSEVVMSTPMDKSWHWGDGYTPNDEEDNVISFKLVQVDDQSGTSYGTTANLAGDDGKWANYMYRNERDLNNFYRVIPRGKSRWSKTADGTIAFYAWEDEAYASPLYTVGQLGAGSHDFWGKSVPVAEMAFYRAFPGPYNVIDWNWPDSRWMADNIRDIFWLMSRSSDEPLADHNDRLAEL